MEDSAERNEMEAHNKGDRWRHEFFVPKKETQWDRESDQYGLCDANIEEAYHHFLRYCALTFIAMIEFRSVKTRLPSKAKSKPDNDTEGAVHDHRKHSRQDPPPISKMWTEAIAQPKRPSDS
jgi:hypothetical protein